MIYWCNKSGFLGFLGFADLYLPKTISIEDIYCKLNSLISDFIGEGARIHDFRNDIEEKLEEFGYIDEDGNVIEEYLIPSVKRVRQILGEN